MIQDIMTNGYVSNKAYLGATIGTLTSGMAQQYRYDISQGAFVYSVEDGSPAAAAGLQLGDVITAIDGTEITSLEDLTAAKKGYAAGDTSTLTVYRQGETITLELTWGAVSADQQSAMQGQTEQDQNTQNGGGYTNPTTSSSTSSADGGRLPQPEITLRPGGGSAADAAEGQSRRMRRAAEISDRAKRAHRGTAVRLLHGSGVHRNGRRLH